MMKRTDTARSKFVDNKKHFLYDTTTKKIEQTVRVQVAKVVSWSCCARLAEAPKPDPRRMQVEQKFIHIECSAVTLEYTFGR